MLSQKYDHRHLEQTLLSREAWRPYPTWEAREAWNRLPASVRRAYLALGEEVAETPWPHVLATRYLDYSRDGNRSRHAEPYFARRSMLTSLTVAECIEGQGRFLDEIVNGIWLICEESSWCIPAHVRVQAAGVDLPDINEPVVDLFAAETGSTLAWVYYLLGDRLDTVSVLVRPRIRQEVEERILAPCLARDDFPWMGFAGQRVNNWNPWINSNWLACLFLMEEDGGKRVNTLSKVLRCLDRFIDPYPPDGGCDEGPSYWGRAGASLLDCLELLHSATQGGIDVYDQPLVQEMGRYIYRVHIADQYFVNFADAPAMLVPPAFATLRYGQRIADEKMMALGAWAAMEEDVLCTGSGPARGRRTPNPLRLLRTLFGLDDLQGIEPHPPLPRDSWLYAIQVMTARDQEGTSDGWFVAAKGGHNAESHNHNDVGQFVVYRDGRPVLVDAGVEEYTRKTFSPERYEIWTMQSAYHNLPTVDGHMQLPGKEFAAREPSHMADAAQARLSLDIAGAYPPEAGIKSWQRTVTLERGQGVEVVDHYAFSRAVGEIYVSLLTPCFVDLSTPGVIALSEAPLPDGRRTGSARITYDGDAFAAAAEEVPIGDARLLPIWGERLWRVLLRAANPPQETTWTLRIEK